MRIRISDISPAGLKVEDTISEDTLNTRLNEGRSCDIRFITPLAVHLTVYQTTGGAETKGFARSRYIQPCASCNDELEREIEVPANFIFKQRPEGTPSDDPRYHDDVGIVWFDGEHIELEEVVQQSFIISLSLYWRPPRRADGSCEICGRQEVVISAGGPAATSLGSLLKSAGLQKK